MNKEQKELLKKCKILSYDEDLPLFDGIYILPTNKIHDSGYKIMYIVGEVHNIKNEKYDSTDYYLIDEYSDVVNLGYLTKNVKEVNIDVKHQGIIHLWNNLQKFQNWFKSSSCTFEFVDRDKKGG